MHDLKFACRQLLKNPGFTTVAVLTLAVGIGANTAMFSVIHAVLLRPLPYPDPGRIVALSVSRRGRTIEASAFTAEAFEFWKEHKAPFQCLAASTAVGFNLTGSGRPERLDALRVASQYFHVYGVEPSLGRDFSVDEDRLHGRNVAVLSYGLWQTHFGGNPHVIGRSARLDGVPYTVIGVMPAGFQTVPPVALWTTIAQVQNTIGSGQNFRILGRLRPGVSSRQADSYLAIFARPFISQFYRYLPRSDRDMMGLVAAPYRYVVSREARRPLWVLFGAVAFVLLIACANVANLLLARMVVRRREMALRLALGAGRGRLVRQLLTESGLLAGLGAALGLLLAGWGVRSLLALAPANLPRAGQVAINGWVLLFAAGVTLLTALLCGLAPGFRASRADLNEPLKGGVGTGSSAFHRHRLSSAMVSAEVGLCFVLLIGSGLLIRTFASLLNTNPGFDPRRMLVLQISTKGSRYTSTPALTAFYRELLRRINAVPGVKSSAVVAAGSPLERGGNDNPGLRVGGQLKFPSVDYREITPGYFRTLGVPLVAGRSFTEADSASDRKVTVINAAFAQRYFRDRSPIGETLVYGHAELEIIGVAADVRSSLNEPAPPTFFVPSAQADYATGQVFQGWFPTCVLVRTAVGPRSLSQQVVSAIRGADPDIPISHVRSMEQVLSLSLALHWFLMTLMGLFAWLALLLAAVGIYGVLSYWVRQRTREIGIRMALGAARKGVLLWVLRHGLFLTLYGVATGVVAALALTRLMISLLYGVTAADAPTFLGALLILASAAFLASYLPARRATRVDPMVALRCE